MMKNFSKKIFSITTANLIFLAVGLLLAISLSVAIAAWSDAQTGGSGQLSEANWNALITQLQTLSPSGWTCTQVTGSWGYDSTAGCASGYKMISGGCDTNGTVSPNYLLSNLYWNAPQGNGWRCAINSSINGGQQIVLAIAQCCQ